MHSDAPEKPNFFVWVRHWPTDIFVVLVPVVYLLHQLEEWNSRAWEIANFAYPGHPGILAMRLFYLSSGIMFIFVVWLARRYKNPAVTAYLLTPLIMLTLLNGAQHVAWTLMFLGYSPGLLCGGVLGLPLGGFVLYRFLKEKRVHFLYVGALGVWVVFSVVQTILLGHHKSPFIKSIYPFIDWLAAVMTR